MAFDTSNGGIVNEGINHILNTEFHAGSQETTWYIGLLYTQSAPPFNANDVMSSHEGWIEITDYDEAARQEFVEAGASGGSITNSANKATFSINGECTIDGAFLCSDSTKNGTTGILMAERLFEEGTRSLQAGDEIQVTVTITLTQQ